MKMAADIAKGLSATDRLILARTPAEFPGQPAYMIATGNVTSYMVAASARAHPDLFFRVQPQDGGTRDTYSLHDLGKRVLCILNESHPMPTNPQIEAEARRATEARFATRLATEDQRNGYEVGYTEGFAAALSPQPTSQDDAGLCERLTRKIDHVEQVHELSTIRLVPELVNPDGPEAAARIATLSADVARMKGERDE